MEVDSVLLPAGQFPAFTTDTPGVTAKQSGPAILTVRDGKPEYSTNYLVTVNQVSTMGNFAAMLSFSLSTADHPNETVFLPVTGNVVGSFAVSPKAVNFGAVASGPDVVRTLILTGSSASSLTQVKVVSDNPSLSAQIVPNTGGSGESCSLNVTLSGKAPVGQLKANISLSYGPNQNLVIPVTANVIGSY